MGEKVRFFGNIFGEIGQNRYIFTALGQGGDWRVDSSSSYGANCQSFDQSGRYMQIKKWPVLVNRGTGLKPRKPTPKLPWII